MDSDEHAEPSVAATPDRSRPSRTASARTPPTATFTSGGARADWSRAPRHRRRTWRRSTSALVRRRGRGLLVLQLPGSPSGTRRCPKKPNESRFKFSRPPRSCPFLGATDDERARGAGPDGHEGSDAGRAPQLVSAERDEVGAERIELKRGRASRCAASRCTGTRRRSTALHDLGHRLQCPDLVVAPVGNSPAPADWRIGAEQAWRWSSRCGPLGPLPSRRRLRGVGQLRARRSARCPRRSSAHALRA